MKRIITILLFDKEPSKFKMKKTGTVRQRQPETEVFVHDGGARLAEVAVVGDEAAAAEAAGAQGPLHALLPLWVGGPVRLFVLRLRVKAQEIYV